MNTYSSGVKIHGMNYKAEGQAKHITDSIGRGVREGDETPAWPPSFLSCPTPPPSKTTYWWFFLPLSLSQSLPFLFPFLGGDLTKALATGILMNS